VVVIVTGSARIGWELEGVNPAVSKDETTTAYETVKRPIEDVEERSLGSLISPSREREYGASVPSDDGHRTARETSSKDSIQSTSRLDDVVGFWNRTQRRKVTIGAEGAENMSKAWSSLLSRVIRQGMTVPRV